MFGRVLNTPMRLVLLFLANTFQTFYQSFACYPDDITPSINGFSFEELIPELESFVSNNSKWSLENYLKHSCIRTGKFRASSKTMTSGSGVTKQQITDGAQMEHWIIPETLRIIPGAPRITTDSCRAVWNTTESTKEQDGSP